MPAIAERGAALYLGAVVGPLGGGVVTVLVPQLRAAFHTSTGVVAAAMAAYLVPFALLQLVSGTVGERLGRRRVVRAGYVVYALSSLAATTAPGVTAFLVIRAIQGSANAFLTPLLLAALADQPGRAHLGRRVGTFTSLQTAGQAFAPLCGGALGALDWRLAFLVPAAVALALAAFPPPASAVVPRTERPRLRTVLDRRIAVLSAAAFGGHAGVTGLGFLVALFSERLFATTPTLRGVILAAFGLGGLLAGRSAGRGVDRFGRVPTTLAGGVASAAAVAALGLAPGNAVLAAIWMAAGVSSAALWAGLNTLAIEVAPHNRGGAVSIVSAARFAGSAAAPLIWLPAFHLHPRASFLAPAALVCATVVLVASLQRRPGAMPARA